MNHGVPSPSQSAGSSERPAGDGSGHKGKFQRLLQHFRYKFDKWRKKRKTPYDPRQIDPRVTFVGRELGFNYMYHPKEVWAHPEQDPEGFSIVLTGGRWHRQPLTHCHITMLHFHQYLETGSEAAKQQFLKGADLLLRARQTVNLGGITCDVWHYLFEVPTYAPHPVPWICCMSQGEAMSVFCRAYQMTGRKEFLEAAKGAMAVYNVPVSEGGILGTDREGHVYYEEYPFPGKTYHVLNGFMYSLMGLYDLYRATGDQEAKRLFEQGIATLTAEGVLDRYDIGYCSRYDQHSGIRFGPAYVRYNLVHVRQLIVLYRITGDDMLRQWAERWFAYSRDPLCRFRCLLESIAWRLRNIPRYVREAITET
jgi:hypothetical protein